MQKFLMLILFATLAPPRLHAQASAIPSAQTSVDINDPTAGRKLLDQMIAALGGDKWLNRTTWVEYGQTGHFYKSTPDPYAVGFEQYNRAEPFAQRVIMVEHVSNLAILGLPGRNHRDVSTVWNDQGGWEVTYKGKTALPKDDVDEFMRVRQHSLDIIVKQWLKQPGTIVTYDGTDTVDRRLAQKISILNEQNDGVDIDIEDATHLPLTLTFKTRNPTYKDFDTETVEYADYHPVDGIQTPFAVSRYKNGDMISERFITKVDYNAKISQDLFDPNHAMPGSPKK